MNPYGYDWSPYVLADYSFLRFPSGLRVLDIGCGDGEQMADLRSQGVLVVGFDPYWPSLVECRSHQLAVAQAGAEDLPVKDASLDGVLCKGVIPYTDEDRAFSEISRVLKDGGSAYCVYLGAGYYLRYIVSADYWKYRAYGLRTLLNTWVFRMSGQTLPGFLGDTIYQSRARLAEFYRKHGFELVEDTPAKTFLGLPVFVYHAIRKTAR